MRGVIVSAVLLIFALTGMFFSQLMLHKQSDNMVAMLSETTKMVKNEQWDEAMRKADEIMELCEKKLKWIEILINHNETDEIRNTVYQLKEYIRYREIPELMATAASLKGEFEHIYDKEKVVFENIF